MTTSSSLNLYFDDLRNLNAPLLSADEELNLIRQMRLDPTLTSESSRQAYEDLITSNLRLVVAVARKYRDKGCRLTFEDLIQEGNLGLMEACKRYDPDLINPNSGKPYRFSTFATVWIKQAIFKAILESGRLVRNPNHIAQQLGNYKKALEHFSSLGIDNPSDATLAKYCGVSTKDVINYRLWLQDAVSSDTVVSGGSDTVGHVTTVGDLVADTETPSPSEVYASIEQQRLIQDAVSHLGADGTATGCRCEVVMRLRFGLGAPTNKTTLDYIKKAGFINQKDWDFNRSTLMTYDDIGLSLATAKKPRGLTRERVRQIIAEALVELREDPSLVSIGSTH